MQIIVTVALVTLLSFNFTSEDTTEAYNYIEKYKEFAVIEMYRSGVPASITMAQALHETNYGRSKMATIARNHFGIKCKTYWEGETYYHTDDDYKNGRLIESCFRAYNRDFDSYIDHSNFLKLTPHYQNLFKLSRTDYKSWAHGLQKSGYATDQRYAQKLIDKIEKYNLSSLDYEEDPYKTLRHN